MRLPRKLKKEFKKMYINGKVICTNNDIRDTTKYGKFIFYIGTTEIPKIGQLYR